MNEFDKMKANLWYDANYDEELLKLRERAQDLCFLYNQTLPSNQMRKNNLLKQLLGYLPDHLTIVSPFICDYGSFITIGENVFINSNAYFMDGGSISIGNHVFIGPNCGFYTAIHPIDKDKRNQGLEKALPITIGNNVWIGGNVVILPGVTIGDNAVIGAGSVVTKNIEANYVAYGNPCKMIRKIDEK